jgi:hypothetical protein
MKERAMGCVAVAAAMMLLVGATATAGEGTWVSDKGHRVHVAGHNAMFFGDGATEIKLADLADGETRVIGMGEKQVTASRRGDEVTISRVASGKGSALDMKCTIGIDNCKIITFDDDPEKVMVVIEKTSTCENGQGDCEDVDVMAMVHGEAGRLGNHMIHEAHGEAGDGVHVIRIKKTVECDDEGNCQDFEEVLGDGEAGLSTVVIEALGDSAVVSGHHGNMFIQKSDQVTLRCSEGDTMMHVEPKEADDVFLCPKHSTPLEKAKGHPRVMRRKVTVDSD